MSWLPIPDLTPLLRGAFWMLCISIPLSLWKLIDIAIWLCGWVAKHVHVTLG